MSDEDDYIEVFRPGGIEERLRLAEARVAELEAQNAQLQAELNALIAEATRRGLPNDVVVATVDRVARLSGEDTDEVADPNAAFRTLRDDTFHPLGPRGEGTDE